MTHRARMKRILTLEERYVAAKLNALGWLQHAMYLKLEQINLCQEGATRVRAQLRLAEDLQFLREHEGLLAACSDAFLIENPEKKPETLEQKKARRWIEDGGNPEAIA